MKDFKLENYKLARVQEDYSDQTTNFEFVDKKGDRVYFVINYKVLKPEKNKNKLVLAENDSYDLVLDSSDLFRVIGKTKLTRDIKQDAVTEQIFCKYIDNNYNFDYVLRNIGYFNNKNTTGG